MCNMQPVMKPAAGGGGGVAVGGASLPTLKENKREEELAAESSSEEEESTPTALVRLPLSHHVILLAVYTQQLAECSTGVM